jgi:hypothetical protein
LRRESQRHSHRTDIEICQGGDHHDAPAYVCVPKKKTVGARPHSGEREGRCLAEREYGRMTARFVWARRHRERGRRRCQRARASVAVF